MLSSRSRDATRSPITEIPYDVLGEIFIHCLPRRPLEIRQPNTIIAPMLLCQICSCWRTIALASPSLWSHLSHSIIAQYIDPNLGSWAVCQKDLDFLMWWKRNQGPMAPFLRLDIDMNRKTPDHLLAADGVAFLLKYITSAQYLQVNWLFWKHIHGMLAGGDQVELPDLHTLVTYRYDPYFYHVQVLIGLGSTHASPPLRRLVMNGFILPVNAIIPTHWSKLTHLFMDEVEISMPAWFSLIQALRDLQWAYITFQLDNIHDNYTKSAAKYTHPNLSALFLTYSGEDSSDSRALPFALMFSNLYLPALQTLSLSSSAESWDDHRSISEIYTVLQSTPAVTTLALSGSKFMSLRKADYPAILSAIGDVRPIWSHAPHLTHLQLDSPFPGFRIDARAENVLNAFVRNIFWPDCRWLPLDSPTCPIQTVTLITGIENASYAGLHSTIKEFMMSSILSRKGEASNVVFFVSKKGADPGELAWKEWDSNKY